ncbi:MAG: PhzF family phenazine biosynthesis protein [Patescibacteria group bacterium]
MPIVHLIKAFTKNPHEGNPAGVVFDADDLTDNQMIQISADLGFSESAFISKSEKADFKIRYFSPTQEVNLCGHATIATFHLLKQEGKIQAGQFTIETKAGLLAVECAEDGLITMTQFDPQFLPYESTKTQIAKLLNLKENDLLNFPLKIVSTGTPKLIIPVKSLEVLLSIKPDLEGIKQFCIESGARGFYPFTSETISADADFHARQFNPLAGINEDPITGVAAGALGAYLKHFKLSPKTNFVVEQGFSMNKPGLIFVDVTDKIKVGGYAVSLHKGCCALPGQR